MLIVILFAKLLRSDHFVETKTLFLVVLQYHPKRYMILILYQNKLLSQILDAFDNF